MFVYHLSPEAHINYVAMVTTLYNCRDYGLNISIGAKVNQDHKSQFQICSQLKKAYKSRLSNEFSSVVQNTALNLAHT